MHVLKDNKEYDGRRIMPNYHSFWMSLCLLYFSCLSHAVSLQTASLVLSMLSTMTADNDSQTTPVRITFVLCFLPTQLCRIL